MNPRRLTSTALLGMNARCHTCDWSRYDNGAQGAAAQHHDRTGHTVSVEVTRCVWYGPV